MAAACETAQIEFITGAELTAEHADNELHILGYFIDPSNQRLLTELAKFQIVRQNRIRDMVARLNELNVPLKAEAVFELANCRSPGRPHVARALVQAGHCKSHDQAFERFLKKGRPAWVPKAKMSALEAIELIHQAGGLAVMAHPALNRADHLIAALVDAGLDGLECFHAKHSAAASRRYLEFAERFRLLITGGSDCHGLSKGKPLIGTVKLPYEHVEKLKAAVRRKTVEPLNC
jgi:predicted metal-dependent phosphoesterase TrpH